jgi:hypothetical protein
MGKMSNTWPLQNVLCATQEGVVVVDEEDAGVKEIKA